MEPFGRNNLCIQACAKGYRVNRLLRTDVTDLVEECNATWLSAWEIWGLVCGDEAVIPHTRSNWHGLRQYIARKPHSTGIKLHGLCHNTYRHVFDAYLYTCRLGRNCRTWTCAGYLDAKGIMRGWVLQVPVETVLVADSFFGSHRLAQYFASVNGPFLIVSKYNNQDEALMGAKQGLAEGQAARGVIKAHGYELVVYKKPKVGHKPPSRLVPFLTSCWFGKSEVQSRVGKPFSPVVAC